MVDEVIVVALVAALTAGMSVALGDLVVVEGRIERGECWVRDLQGRVLGDPCRT